MRLVDCGRSWSLATEERTLLLHSDAVFSIVWVLVCASKRPHDNSAWFAFFRFFVWLGGSHMQVSYVLLIV